MYRRASRTRLRKRTTPRRVERSTVGDSGKILATGPKDTRPFLPLLASVAHRRRGGRELRERSIDPPERPRHWRVQCYEVVHANGRCSYLRI